MRRFSQKVVYPGFGLLSSLGHFLMCWSVFVICQSALLGDRRIGIYLHNLRRKFSSAALAIRKVDGSRERHVCLFPLPIRILTAILVQRHCRGSCRVIAVRHAPHGNLDHVVEHSQNIGFEASSLVANHECCLSLESVSMKIRRVGGLL